VSARLQALAGAARPWVLPYVTAGYPSLAETGDLLLAAEAAGATAVEVGLPFSDPLADGPVIQRCSQASLAAGTTLGGILETVAGFRARSDLPVILMGYANPILRRGAERFFAEAAAAGADGLIVPDLPVEEARPHLAAAREAGLAWTFLAAPTSPPGRLAEVDRESDVFSYCVSVAGVTGARDELPADLDAYLRRMADLAEKPFVVGFGISRADQVARVVPPAAGVVVGSALLRAVEEAPDAPGRRAAVTRVVRALRGAD
jgi:tryptophan synthase alpha chain